MQRLTQPSGESLFRRFGFAAEKRGKPELSAMQTLEPLGPSFAKGFLLHQDYGGQDRRTISGP